MKMIKGVFISDIHFPHNVPLRGVLAFIKDYKPDQIILGGDITDGPDHGVDSWNLEKVETRGYECYANDVNNIKSFMDTVSRLAPNAKIIYLEGNHEERYERLVRRWPNNLKSRFNLHRDACPSAKWIKYGDYDSFYQVGDCLFTHGTIFPDQHAKKMAQAYLPSKVVYGHIHDFQSYTTHSGDPRKPGRYALTSGCLCGRLPDYKKGHPNKWVTGFVSWVSVDGCTTPTPHIIENGLFAIGSKVYG